MKTSILVILFLLCSQILSQIESHKKINHRDFLKERKPHSTNPPNQREQSFEANIFQNNDSRRGVNNTALNSEFLLIEQIEQFWDGNNWVNYGLGRQGRIGEGRHTYLYNANNMIEDIRQDWDDSSWVNYRKDTYIYDANDNMIEGLYQYWDESSWANDS